MIQYRNAVSDEAGISGKLHFTVIHRYSNSPRNKRYSAVKMGTDTLTESWISCDMCFLYKVFA